MNSRVLPSLITVFSLRLVISALINPVFFIQERLNIQIFQDIIIDGVVKSPIYCVVAFFLAEYYLLQMPSNRQLANNKAGGKGRHLRHILHVKVKTQGIQQHFKIHREARLQENVNKRVTVWCFAQIVPRVILAAGK